jgi:hypothetical protein
MEWKKQLSRTNEMFEKINRIVRTRETITIDIVQIYNCHSNKEKNERLSKISTEKY